MEKDSNVSVVRLTILSIQQSALQCGKGTRSFKRQDLFCMQPYRLESQHIHVPKEIQFLIYLFFSSNGNIFHQADILQVKIHDF